MLIIECPYCGPRDQSEFSNGGEAHVKRPDGSQNISDREWAEYVFIRSNPKGLYYERWVHSHGCRKWFNCVRDTSTDEILGIHMIGPRCADLISEAVVAMEFRASAEDIARISHAHPTFSEAIKEAALAATEDRPIHI